MGASQSRRGDTVAVLGTAVDAPSLGAVRGLEDNGAPALMVISRSMGAIQSVQRSGDPKHRCTTGNAPSTTRHRIE